MGIVARTVTVTATPTERIETEDVSAMEIIARRKENVLEMMVVTAERRTRMKTRKRRANGRNVHVAIRMIMNENGRKKVGAIPIQLQVMRERKKQLRPIMIAIMMIKKMRAILVQLR